MNAYLTRYPMIQHSYIIELKYLKRDDDERKAEEQWSEALRQIRQYAQDPKLRQMCQGTQLHLIVAQIKGYDMTRLEEV